MKLYKKGNATIFVCLGFLYCLLFFTMLACNSPAIKKTKTNKQTEQLPVLSRFKIEKDTLNGKIVADTIYQTIPNYSLTNQFGQNFSLSDIEGKVYIADFFFTSCPDICPNLSKNLAILQEKLKNEDDFVILSHTIDPTYDTPERLNEYAERYGAIKGKWFFLTGSKDSIYHLAKQFYRSWAIENDSIKGGFGHAPYFILVDKNRLVRGFYDGLRAELIPKMINDINKLLKND